jgi:hypothetical protein
VYETVLQLHCYEKRILERGGWMIAVSKEIFSTKPEMDKLAQWCSVVAENSVKQGEKLEAVIISTKNEGSIVVTDLMSVQTMLEGLYGEGQQVNGFTFFNVKEGLALTVVQVSQALQFINS